MTKAVALAFCVAGFAALAATPEEGAAIYRSACAQCHLATQPLYTPDGKGKPSPVTAKTPWAGPDLVKVITTYPAEKVRAWIAGPTKIKPNTSCRIFAMPRPSVDALLAYLTSVSKPPALTKKAQLNKNLKEGLERRRHEAPPKVLQRRK